MRKIIAIGLIIVAMMSLTGCKDIVIFEKPVDQETSSGLSKNNLQEDTYYVKDGTKFYPVYLSEGTINNEAESVSPDRLLWVVNNIKKVPVLYQNEILAYRTSKSNTLDNVNIERFYDLGYSIGVHGAVYTDEGIQFNKKDSAVESSSLGNYLSNIKAESIIITAIDDKPVTKNMLSPSGTIDGLEEGKEYKISLYAGTYYKETKIKADTQMLQSYELYNINDVSNTENGYLNISLPQDAKSGYYAVNMTGLFKYYSYEKKDGNVKSDMNEKYYQTEEDQMKAYSQQYVFMLEDKKKNISVDLTYAKTSENVKAILTAPDGKEYTLKKSEENETPQENKLTCSLSEAIPGKWTVNITPTTVVIENLEVTPSGLDEEATKEEFPIEANGDMENSIFIAEYEGEGTITGIVIDDKGTTYDMMLDAKKHRLTYDAKYIKEGNYKVVIYHYPDTKITSAYAGKDTSNSEIDVITVTE